MNLRSIISVAAMILGATMSACAQSAAAIPSAKANEKALVVYFSRTGNNYAVGNISEGNTAIIARMIADRTGADIFEIKPAHPYPDDYTRCTEVARDEKEADSRPAIVGDINTDGYTTVYIGYPIWWGDAPMPVYTFIDRHDWKGKTVIPFCTHEGSGLSGTEHIAAACKGSTSAPGLAVKGTVAQNERDKARALVKQWINKKK